MTTIHTLRTGRRQILKLATAGVASLLSIPAVHAADFPDRPIKIIVNFPPGGPLDIIARSVAARLTTTLKQPVFVENVSGASGNIGAMAVARAQPDGLTILFSLDTPFTMTPLLTPDANFRPNELRTVSLMAVTASAVVANPSLGVQSMAELVEKGRREIITFATAGSGSPGHFAALLFAEATGAKVNPIHYRGNAPAVLAVVSGEVQAGILGTGGVAPHVKAGKLKGLALAGTQRSALLPDVPTTKEAGYPDLELQFMFLAMVSAKTPDAQFKALNAAISEALRQPDIQQRLLTIDASTVALDERQAIERLDKARVKYAKVVKESGMKAE